MIESWRTSSGQAAATDVLELLWIEHHVAPAEPVTLLVRRGRERHARKLADARWAMTVKPPLEASARDAHQRAGAGGPTAWEELERQLEGAGRPTAAWAAFRRGKAAAAAVDRAEETALAFERARDLAGRPEIVALLHALEGETLWQATQYDRSTAPLIEADRALEQIDAASPLLALNSIRVARNLVRERRVEGSREAIEKAEEVLEGFPDAHVFRAMAVARRGSVEATAGNYELAAGAYRAVLASLPQGDPFREGMSLNLGRTLVERGIVVGSVRCYPDQLPVRACRWPAVTPGGSV